MMFKSLNGLAPVYSHDLFSERHTDYAIRSDEGLTLETSAFESLYGG